MPDSTVLVGGRYVGEGLFGAGEPNETLLPAFGDALDGFNVNELTARFGREGELLWAKGAGGPEIDNGTLWIAAPDGESFLTGAMYENSATFGTGEPDETTLYSELGGSSHALARYTTDGELEWAIRAIDADSAAALPGMASLPDGSVVMTGWFWDSIVIAPETPEETVFFCPGSSESDMVLARFAPDGALTWAKQIPGPFIYDNLVRTIRLLDGTIVTGGRFKETVVLGAGEENETTLDCDVVESGQACPFVAGFSSDDGHLLWAKEPGYTASLVLMHLAAAPEGGFALTAAFAGAGVLGAGEPNETAIGSADDPGLGLVIARYGPDGSLWWAREVEHVSDSWNANERNLGYPIAFLDSGQIVVGGVYGGDAPVFGPGEPNETVLPLFYPFTLFVALYYANGNLAWVVGQDGSNEGNAVTRVAVLGDDTFFVGGSFGNIVTFGTSSEDRETMTAAGDCDVFVLRFDRNVE